MTKKIITLTAVITGSLFLLLVLVSVFNVAFPVMVTTTTKTTEFSVVGEGKVEVVPNTAYVDVGITINNGADVTTVQNNINQTNNKIIEAMKKLGIKKEDVKTSNYSVNPNYNYDGKNNVIDGYNGNVTISIKITNIDLASKVVEEATKAGANQVNGTRFVVDSPEKYREEARNKAIENAKQQAQKLASNLGIKLGKITNVVEAGDNSNVPIAYGLKTMNAAASGLGGTVAPQMEPGSQTISSVVTLYFEKR